MDNHFLCAFHHSKSFLYHHKKHWLNHLQRGLKEPFDFDLHQKNRQKNYQKVHPYHHKDLQQHQQYLQQRHQVQPMDFLLLIQKDRLALHHKEGWQYNELHREHLLCLKTFAQPLIHHRLLQQVTLFLKHLLLRQVYRKHL